MRKFALFLLIGVVSGCGIDDQEALDNMNNDYTLVGTSTEAREQVPQPVLESHMSSGRLQAISESFNYENIHERLDYPKEGIVAVRDNGTALYENGAEINRRGMLVHLPNRARLTASQQPAYIRRVIHDISEDVVYVDGQLRQVSQAFYQQIDQINTDEIHLAQSSILQKDMLSKLNGTKSCYRLSGGNEALQEYLGSIVTILQDAYDENDYVKYAEAAKRLYSLNYAINRVD